MFLPNDGPKSNFEMKKIISILSTGLAILIAASCNVKEDLAVLDPSLCTPPVITSSDVTEDGITVNFTPATLNVAAPVYHTLVMKSLDGNAVEVVLGSIEKGGALTLTPDALSRTLMSLGYEDGDVVSLEMVVRASPQQKPSGNHIGYIDSDARVSVRDFTVIVPKGSPYINYTQDSDWSLIGALSAYGISWDGDLNMWTDGNGNHVAAHVTLKAGDEVKFRKDQAWAENMGGSFTALDAEFDVTQDGPNIVIDKDGVYDLYLYTGTGKAMVTAAYDPYPEYTETSNWSVIGALTLHNIDWNGDIPMITDGTWHVALGVNLDEDDEFKFRQDAGWAVNMGGSFEALDADFTVTQDGSNIIVGTAGVYDLFVNPGEGLARVSVASGAKVSSVIGSEEPGPGPETVTGWNIIGLNGDWENDVLATQNGNVWTVFITAEGDTEFKWRKDGDWAENYGGTFVTLGEPFEAVAGGDNIKIGAGFYKVELNLDDMTITISSGDVYSLIGEINGDAWSKDVVMTENDGIWSSVTVSIEGGFKIRHNASWADEDVYGAEDGFTAEPGVAFTAVQPGSNISVAPGQYKVTFNPATKEVLISESKYPEHLYMIGEEFGGWDWNSDGVVEMTPVVHQPDWGAEAEGQFWAVRYISAGKGFKFCSQRAWSGDFWGLTYNDGFTEAGGNCTVAEDGIYLIHVDFKNEKVHVEPARVYGIGNCFGGWTAEMPDALFKAEGKVLKATTVGEGELRMYVASSISTSDWWTREFIFFEDGVIDYRGDDEGQGDQARFNVLMGQTVTLDFNAGTGSLEGEGQQADLPETMYIIGEGIGGWDWGGDYIVDMTPVNGKNGQFWAIRYIEGGKGFKFCAVKDWNGDFFSLGEDIGFTTEGGNCLVAENGVYMIYVDCDAKKICVEKARVYGIGDCFGAWDQEMPEALFTEADGKLVGTVKADGELRMYAASSIATSDWWTREFIILDGKIAYRGNGGDQERVNVKAGSKVTLDFNAGTGVIESEGGQPAAGITIDGDMSDWEGIQGATGTGINSVFKVSSDEQNIYFYVKRTTERMADIWGGAAYHYYTFDMDNNPDTGVELWGNGPYELLLVIYPYAGSADAPAFGIAAAGTAAPDNYTVDNAVIKGVVTDSGVETEIAVPRSDIMAMPTTPVNVYSWSNKGGGDKLEVTVTL